MDEVDTGCWTLSEFGAAEFLRLLYCSRLTMKVRRRRAKAGGLRMRLAGDGFEMTANVDDYADALAMALAAIAVREKNRGRPRC